MVEKMKTLFRTMVLGSLLALSANSYALSGNPKRKIWLI